MRSKIESIVFVVLLLFAGFVAVTQELDVTEPEIDYELHEDEDYYNDDFIQEPKEPTRWFRSNAGGIAIQEVKSRLVALRSEYSLSIDTAFPYEVPGFLRDFYIKEHLIEVRTLYNNGMQIRTQWILKDTNGRTRVNASVTETPEVRIKKIEVITEEEDEAEEGEDEESEKIKRIVKTEIEREEIVIIKKGFIEVFDDEYNLISEYTYLGDDGVSKIDFEYDEGFLINSVSLKWTEDENGGKFVKAFIDFYRYNRSQSLRLIERMFYIDMQANEDDLVKISFPRNVRDASLNETFVEEKLNMYPEFFGDVFIYGNSRMIYQTDNKGRILKQTLYDEEDVIIWVINNSWFNNRITVTRKTQGDTVLTAEYQYNSAGDRRSEKNIKDGVLERHVKIDGNKEIEELYMNNVVVLRAVWEDGIKISETRVR